MTFGDAILIILFTVLYLLIKHPDAVKEGLQNICEWKCACECGEVVE